jgi:hypothetical protein
MIFLKRAGIPPHRRAHALELWSVCRAHAPLSTMTAAHLNQIFHCKVLDVGKGSFLLKNDVMHALNTAPLRPLNL